MADATVTTPTPMTARAAALARLADEDWDVVVIGGGIVGSGVLLDVVSRGLRAALVEQDDLAVGTSSRSSRLIHGGVRYLEDMRLQLVREALAERSRLMTLAPHLVHLERFLFPVYGWPIVHRAMYSAGLTLYDLLGAARDGGRAHHLGAGAVAELIPSIVRHRLRGGVTYSDGVEDDARYSIAVARTAIAKGATAVTRTRATGLLTADDGRVNGLTVRDLIGGEELTVRASRVIDATGVWLGHPEARLGGSTMKLVPSRGSHLLFERDRIPMRTGLTLKIPGRVLFVIPSPGAWIVGTTDEPDAGSPDRPAPTGHEVDHILETVNGVLALDLSRKDALGAYAGLRPLVGAPGGDTARISREHTIHREASGLVRVSGGKYTTYRLMARDAVDMALEGRDPAPRSSTAGLALLGAAPRDELDRLASELAVRGRPRRLTGSGPRRPARHAGPGRPGAGPRARPAAAAGRRHPAARGRGGLGRPPRAGPRAGRRALATHAPLDGPPRSLRQHRAARGRHHGRRPRLGRGAPGGRGGRLPGHGAARVRRAIGGARGRVPGGRT